MDIKETLKKINKEGQSIRQIDESFVRTMEKDMAVLNKQRPVIPPRISKIAREVKQAVPPAGLPVAEPAKRPISPPSQPAKPEPIKPELSRKPIEPEKPAEKKPSFFERLLSSLRPKAKPAKPAPVKPPVPPKIPIPPKPALPTEPIPVKPVGPAKPIEPAKAAPPVKKGKPKIALPKIRLKFVLTGLAIIIIIGGIGGFFYWWNYLRPAPITHYQCQDSQCIEVKGQGQNQCQTDEDCQPSHYECQDSQCLKVAGQAEDQCLSDEDCQPIEPTTPPSLMPVDETETIELAIDQEDLLLEELKSIIQQEQALDSSKRILVKLVGPTEIKYACFNTLISSLGISLPADIISAIAVSDVETGNYTLFIYSQPEGNRLGLVIDMGQSDSLVQDLKNWEETIVEDLKPILLSEELPAGFTEEFQDNLYQEAAIRYMNFPLPDLSVDYAIVAGKLVLTTSRESMYAAINALLEGGEEAALSIEECMNQLEESLAGEEDETILGEIIVGFLNDVSEEEAEDIIGLYGLEIIDSVMPQAFLVKVPENDEIEWVCKLSENEQIEYAELNREADIIE